MRVRISIMVLFILSAGSMAAFADNSQQAVMNRMKARDPILLQLKEIGKIGETYLGYIDVIDPKDKKDVGLVRIINEENKDRNLLYKSMAQQTSQNTRLIGQQIAYRIFQEAQDDVYFLDSDGVWRQKKDMVTDAEPEAKAGEKGEE